MAGHSVFSVDVEEWFHILDVPSTPPMERWGTMESRVEASFGRMLEVFAEKRVRTTLFFLGWVAERHPQLVRAAAAQGHEIASHGYAHELVYKHDRRHFTEDVRRAKGIIEDAAGVRVRGYRAPGFSVTQETPWFFEALAETGHAYDSSIWPGSRNHGGWPGALPVPHVVPTAKGDIVEFPISLGSAFGRPLYFFGGGYLRFFPYAVIRDRARAVLQEQRPVVFYLHPREVDPGHPRLPMSAKRRFMSYVNLATTEPKMRRLFDDLPMTTFGELLDAGVDHLPRQVA
ncbi:MAG: polysaccharide deacetylase family protein [Flavobacteriales bacterium]|nr:polysaccharide deacetylase family protein [Flavobacteriales bacterium]